VFHLPTLIEQNHCPLSSRLSHSLPEWRVVGKTRGHLGKGGDVVHGAQQAGNLAFDYLRQRRCGRGDHRQPAGHRFGSYQAEAFQTTGEQQGVSGLIGAHEFGSTQPSQAAAVAGQAVLPMVAVAVGGVVEFEIRAEALQERAQQADALAFAPVADIEQAEGGVGVRTGQRVKGRGIQAVVNDLDILASEDLAGTLCAVAADSSDHIGALEHSGLDAADPKPVIEALQWGLERLESRVVDAQVHGGHDGKVPGDESEMHPGVDVGDIGPSGHPRHWHRPWCIFRSMWEPCYSCFNTSLLETFYQPLRKDVSSTASSDGREPNSRFSGFIHDSIAVLGFTGISGNIK